MAVENVGIIAKNSKVTGVITVSNDLLTASSGPDVTVDYTYQRADESLYQANEAEKNQAVSDVFVSLI